MEIGCFDYNNNKTVLLPFSVALQQAKMRMVRWMCAPHPKQITTPAAHHSVFYSLDALPATQPTASKHCLNFLLDEYADLHMAQLMPLPLTVSCFSKIQIASGTGSPGNPVQSPEGRKMGVCVYELKQRLRLDDIISVL